MKLPDSSFTPNHNFYHKKIHLMTRPPGNIKYAICRAGGTPNIIVEKDKQVEMVSWNQYGTYDHTMVTCKHCLNLIQEWKSINLSI